MSNWWEDFAWRQIQTNLREIDMIDISAEQVLADLQAFQATVLMINAAGIIASYPTKLPFHFQSPFLQGDSLQEIIRVCHNAGIRVTARTDFSKVRRPIYEMHPDWAYISPAGHVVDYNGDIAVCINGPYQQQYALQIIEELITTHDFDGIFFNMGGFQTRDYSGNYYGICQCANCQNAFETMFGLPLPTQEEIVDPVYRKYVVFKERIVAAYREKVYNLIHALRPDMCVDKAFHAGRGFVRQESNTAIDRALPHWQYSASDNTKWVTSSYPQMVSSNTTVDFIDFPYRHVTVSPHQQRLRLAQNLANGGALDYYIIGRLDNHEDRSGYADVQELFHYHAANEESYRRLRSRANIALLNSRAYGNQAEFRGWFRFLAENHFLFDTLMDEAALDLSWDQYDVIVLPDLQAVSDTLAARLDAFVQQGGTLIAVAQSAFRDEYYELRAQPALRSLGIEQIQQVRQDMRSAYFKLDDKRGFARFDEVDLLYMDGLYVYAQYLDDVKQRFKLIPPHSFGPPERCYYEQATDHPGFVVNSYGHGKAIYIPWRPGTLFHRQGYVNSSEFAADLLEGVAGVTAVRGNLSPMVEVTRFGKTDGSSELLHLVNGSGHFGVSFFAPVPMTALEATITCEQRPTNVRSLVNAVDYVYHWQDGQLTIEVPQLELFDAIQIQWLQIT